MSEIISVSNIGKKYKRYPSKHSRVIEWISAGLIQKHEAIWVLKGLDFTVQQGESIGIIGQNGAGKSTLLKILTGSTRATEGQVAIKGRVAALLELGMGFHPDFTGIQNAITACQIMGITTNDAHSLLPSIIEFSELKEYIHQPIRTYSSGMQMRLAFSVATAIRPDILIVDEALSVGDTYFQHKSMAKIREFKELGTTLFFVSHDPSAVKSLCERAILLDQGIIVRDGTPDNVFDYYNAIIAKKEKDEEIRLIENQHGTVSTRSGNQKVIIKSIEMLDSSDIPCRAFRVGDKVTIKINVYYNEPIENATVGILIKDRLGNEVFGTNTFHQQLLIPFQKGNVNVRYTLELNIGIGNYSISIASHTLHSHIEDSHDWWDQAVVFQVIPNEENMFIGVAALPVSVELNAT